MSRQRCESRVYWTCSTCGGRVTDSGPYEPHPDDQERGHTEGCDRHQRAITAYYRRIDAEEGGDWS